jgi:hypothetical protein
MDQIHFILGESGNASTSTFLSLPPAYVIENGWTLKAPDTIVTRERTRLEEQEKGSRRTWTSTVEGGKRIEVDDWRSCLCIRLKHERGWGLGNVCPESICVIWTFKYENGIRYRITKREQIYIFDYFRPSLCFPIAARACFPAKMVKTLRIPPYSNTSPSLRSTQYQKRRPSNAPRSAMNGRTFSEKMNLMRGTI